jgi:hypothetical protein
MSYLIHRFGRLNRFGTLVIPSLLTEEAGGRDKSFPKPVSVWIALSVSPANLALKTTWRTGVRFVYIYVNQRY